MSPDTNLGQTAWQPNSELLVPQKFTYDWFKEGINERIPDKKKFAASALGLGLTAFAMLHPITAHAETTGDFPGDPVDTVPLDGTTPTLTRTPRPLVPTFTPTRTPTPEATPTPVPFEVPITDIDALKPSGTFSVHISNVDDVNLRNTPIKDSKNTIRQVKKDEKIYRTGNEVDGWVEMFLPTEEIFAFASASVFSSTNISPTIQERIAFQKFDIAPSTQISLTTESIVTSFNNATGLGGPTEKNAKIDGLIDSFWGNTNIRTQARSDAFSALQANIAVAVQTFAVDPHEPNINVYGNPVYVAQDKSGSYFATSLRMGAGTDAVFMVTTTKKGEDGSIQADKFEFYNWAGIVKKMGSLDSAMKMANSIGQIDQRYVRFTIKGETLVGSPDGQSAMKLFDDIEAYNKGKANLQPIPASTPASIATATPTKTPTRVPPTARVTPVPPIETAQPAAGGEEINESIILPIELSLNVGDYVVSLKDNNTLNIIILKMLADQNNISVETLLAQAAQNNNRITAFLPVANAEHGGKTTSIKFIPKTLDISKGITYRLGDLTNEYTGPGSSTFHENIVWGKNGLMFKIEVVEGRIVITLNEPPLQDVAKTSIDQPGFPVAKQLEWVLGDRVASATNILSILEELGSDMIEHPPQNMTSDDLQIIAQRKRYENDPQSTSVFREMLKVIKK